MSKNIHTPREELVCGKIDKALEIARALYSAELVYILDQISFDVSRMEAMLVRRKDEADKQRAKGTDNGN